MVKQVASCASVIDGDTFETDSKHRIRLARVYVPEISTTAGLRARNKLMAIINRRVISYEVVARDDYGTSICEVWVGNVNVNDSMIAQGYYKSQ